MGLWGHINRVMLIVARVSVLAACYAVAAWGQAGDSQRILPGNRSTALPTVSVVALQIPDSAWRHFEKAKSAAARHREDEFERESAKALAIAPRFASMYLLRATVQMRTQHYDAALASAQAAAQADPGAMWTAVILAGAYNGLRRFNEARLVLAAARGIETETWQAEYERARAETGVRDVAAALHWSDIVLRSAPKNFSDVRLVRINALLLADRCAEAAAQIDLYLESSGRQQHRDQVIVLREAVRARLAVDEQARAQAASATLPRAAIQLASVQPQSASR